MFDDFDFNRLNDPSFKESDVREEIIMPILNKLGFQGKNIVREMSLKSNVVREGSKDKIITRFPDYVLKDNDKILFVLDAKSPKESMIDNDHIGQVFSYAMHSEVQTSICILCNGREMAVFNIPKHEPILIFNIQEIDTYFEELKSIILPSNSNTKNSSRSSPKK